VFYEGKLVKEADSDSFKVLDRNFENSLIAEDDVHQYSISYDDDKSIQLQINKK